MAISLQFESTPTSIGTRRTGQSLTLSVEPSLISRNRFLKFELPTTIQSDFATYENAFGCISRPTTRNTTWERAKFEVVGHKFCDLSEFGYGVALIDESKYGHACEGSTMRLSLLRGALILSFYRSFG